LHEAKGHFEVLLPLEERESLATFDEIGDRLCGLVVRVPAYSSRGPGFDSRRYQIFREIEGLNRGPLSLVRIIEELFQENSSSGLENRD
jgi:hypothetical protein